MTQTNNSIEMESLPLSSQKRKDSLKENVVSEVFNDYCSSTSIHGMGYLGARDKNLAEKIWWIIVIIISVVCCCYLISRTWIKWQTNPVILSFEQEQTPIWKIPFPAVTICPLNKVQQMTYNYTEMFRNQDKLEDEEYKEFWDISLICDLDIDIIPFNCSINITDKQSYTNIRNVAPAMDEVFLQITWQGKAHNDTEIRKLFAEQITQEGICFTFNSLNQYDMYTKALNHEITYINHTIKNSGWNLENGFPLDSALNNFPRRTAKDGSRSGLSITLYTFQNNTEYVCGPSMSGYKIILHNPSETPRPSQQYYLIPVNKQVVLTVKPEMTTTSENLRSMSSSARKCYFSNEKSLKFFRVYTQNNCRIECTVNVTKKICGCVPFNMPRAKETPICGFARMDCVFKTEVKMINFEMLEKGAYTTTEIKETEAYKIFDRCNCMPSCSDLQFTAETSQTDIHAITSLLASGLDNQLPPEVVHQMQIGAISVTQLEIFYKESQFLALHRSELYGRTDFLANCGGLLGLFMGFSLLSLIEIFYFMTIRLCVKWRNRKKEN